MGLAHVGDVLTLTWAYGQATTAALTVTAPDGTTSSPAVTGSSTYTASYTPTQAGRHVLAWTGTGTNPGSYVDALNVRPTGSGPLVSLQETREHLNIYDTSADSQLLAMVLRASSACDRYTHRVWRRTVVTGELHDGRGPALQLLVLPVLQVTAVREFGGTVDAADYVLDGLTGVLTRGTTLAPIAWLPGVQNVAVDYVAGPAGGIVPEDVLQGVLEMVRHLWESQRGGSGLPRQQGSDSEWDPRASYSVPRRVAELWDPYREPVIA